MAKPNRERQADMAARNRMAGRVPRQKWAHRQDWPAIDAFIDRMNRVREQSQTVANDDQVSGSACD